MNTNLSTHSHNQDKKNQLHFTSEDLNLKGFNHSKNTGEKRKFKFPGDQQTHDEESYDPQC